MTSKLRSKPVAQPLAAAPRSLPFVLVNMSMTADGKIATANRAVSSFGSPRDQRHLHELRTTADAVMCGARTANAPDVTLGVGGDRFRRRREQRRLAPEHLRVVVTGNGSLEPTAGVFRHPGAPIVILTTQRAGARRLARLRDAADAVHVSRSRTVNLRQALAWLYRRCGVRRLLCEGGGELNAALFRAGLVNELHLTLCPFLFGGRSAPTLADGLGAERLADAAEARLKSCRRQGDELYLVYAFGPASTRG